MQWLNTLICALPPGVSAGSGEALHPALRLAHGPQQHPNVGGGCLVWPTPQELLALPHKEPDQSQCHKQHLLPGLPKTVCFTTALNPALYVFFVLCSDLNLLCFSVSVLGVYNYTTADFVRGDVYNTIRTYLYVGSSKSFKNARVKDQVGC